MKNQSKYLIEIPIGDYSCDGHSECNWHIVESNVPLDEVFEAYFIARKIMPQEVCPEYICKHAGERCIPNKVMQKLDEYGFNISYLYNVCEKMNNGDCILNDSYQMLEIMLWFIRKGNSKIEFKIMSSMKFINENIPKILHLPRKKFIGHIGHIGYGIFGEAKIYYKK